MRDTVTLLWACLWAVVVGVPAGMWVLTRRLASSEIPPSGSRIDRWLYDRYPLRDTDRWRVRRAVLDGEELSDPLLRTAACGLAAAMLTGQIRGMSPKTGWLVLGAAGGLIVAILAVALGTGHYSILSGAVVGVPLMALAVVGLKRTQYQVERARQLNE